MNPEQPKLIATANLVRKFSKRKKYRLPERSSKDRRIHELDFLNFLARVQS